MSGVDQAKILQARNTLLRRGAHCAMRARRARIGSNERQKAVRAARTFSACVAVIDADKKLRKGLAKTGWNRGWRELLSIVVQHERERERNAQKLGGQA